MKRDPLADAIETMRYQRNTTDRKLCDALRRGFGNGEYLARGRLTKGMRKAVWDWVKKNPSPRQRSRVNSIIGWKPGA